MAVNRPPALVAPILLAALSAMLLLLIWHTWVIPHEAFLLKLQDIKAVEVFIETLKSKRILDQSRQIYQKK